MNCYLSYLGHSSYSNPHRKCVTRTNSSWLMADWLMLTLYPVVLGIDFGDVRRYRSGGLRHRLILLIKLFTKFSLISVSVWPSSESSSSSSLPSASCSVSDSSSLSWSSAQVAGANTASFAVFPKASTCVNNVALQIGHSRMFGRRHSTWKECPQP